MIILDTNVVSALMRLTPDGDVVRLLDQRPLDSVYTTTITLFEVRFGIERLPDSRRRRQLEQGFEHAFDRMFHGHILPFDDDAAASAALLSAERARRGRSMEMRDTMIAGIVISHRAEFATHNVRHFDDLDVSVVDPWAG